MFDSLVKPSGRILDPIDRVSEILFGLIMVLTFTGSLGIADAGGNEVRVMLIGALGCNLAWGIIDAILHVMGRLAERSRDLATYRAVREAADPDQAARLVRDALPPLVGRVLTPPELEAIRARLTALPEPPAQAHLRSGDWLEAAGVFLLVFLSMFPVAIPFLILGTRAQALRASNAVAIVMLFLTGFLFGRLTGRHPVWVGCSMVALGAILVGLTMALGG
jgi:VIT1/CCC1 family predicted Fe2+/Mn2+ transporter